jgi:hypothetical protein
LETFAGVTFAGKEPSLFLQETTTETVIMAQTKKLIFMANSDESQR